MFRLDAIVILRAKEHLVETSASFTEVKLSTDLENLYCFNFLHIGLSVRYKILPVCIPLMKPADDLWSKVSAPTWWVPGGRPLTLLGPLVLRDVLGGTGD